MASKRSSRDETKRKMNVRIMRATRNAGLFTGESIDSLESAMEIIRAERRDPEAMVWVREGRDWAGYASAEDSTDEDKAVARLRPV